MTDRNIPADPSGTCPRCKEWKLYVNRCRCELFLCGEPWQGKVEDWHEVFATDAEEAAEKCAERFDCEGDYTIIRNGGGEIWTKDAEDKLLKWTIEAESVPQYSARQAR